MSAALRVYIHSQAAALCFHNLPPYTKINVQCLFPRAHPAGAFDSFTRVLQRNHVMKLRVHSGVLKFRGKKKLKLSEKCWVCFSSKAKLLLKQTKQTRNKTSSINPVIFNVRKNRHHVCRGGGGSVRGYIFKIFILSDPITSLQPWLQLETGPRRTEDEFWRLDHSEHIRRWAELHVTPSSVPGHAEGASYVYICVKQHRVKVQQDIFCFTWMIAYPFFCAPHSEINSL